MHQDLSIINKTYQAYKSIVQINHSLDRRWRYGVGVGLENTMQNLLEELIMAKSAPKPLKVSYLIRASAQQELASLKLRLYLELKLANETQIFQAQAKLVEIGRMLGGWRKSLQ